MNELILFVKKFLFGRCKNKNVGLFGTCGNSTWRNPYVSMFETQGITYFNPMFTGRDHRPDDAAREANHLASDRIILFPVLAETDGIVSLAEIGQAEIMIAMSWNRHLVIYIEPEVNSDFFNVKPDLAKKSNQMRMLLTRELSQVKHPRIHIVNSLSEMWDTTWKIIASL